LNLEKEEELLYPYMKALEGLDRRSLSHKKGRNQISRRQVPVCRGKNKNGGAGHQVLDLLRKEGLKKKLRGWKRNPIACRLGKKRFLSVKDGQQGQIATIFAHGDWKGKGTDGENDRFV